VTLQQGEPGARLEARLRMEPDGRVTVFSGKVEFGQGIRTAFAKIVSAELGVPIDRITVVLGDTAQVPYDRGTFGSRSIAQDGEILRRAAAQARRLLADGKPLEGPIPDDVPGAAPLPDGPRRIEAPDIVTGRARYTADVRLPGMLRGAIARPPARGASVSSVDDTAARVMPGVIAVVRDGDLVGIVADRSAQAQAAVQALEIDWTVPASAEQHTTSIPIAEDAAVDGALVGAATRVEALYSMPYISNAPIGPSAAVADVRPDGTTIYAGTQRPFGLRDEAAAALGVPPETVRVIPQMPSGTYGRNSLSDAGIEAARLSKACGRPVLLQWTREDEFAHGPARPACALDIAAGTDADGRFVAWRYHEHTNAHGYGGALDPRLASFTSGRNAMPPYQVLHVAVTLHIEPSDLRTASFRSLAAAENVFAIESLVDEIAAARGEDPLELRLRNTRDPRLRAVLETVALRSGWRERPRGDGHGFGMACTLYAHGTYIAQVAEVTVAPNGRIRLGRFWCTVDPGRVIDENGVRNQCEGAIVQSASWTLLEELKQRDGRVASTGWDTYPIATFRDVPTEIDVQVMGTAGEPPTGVGEPPGVPVAAAIANAVFAACGARVRDLPITADRVRAARG
jgi:CO/xanthine dehydrogenase Mo-binding subunit